MEFTDSADRSARPAAPRIQILRPDEEIRDPIAAAREYRRELAREFDDTYRTGSGYQNRNLETYHEYFDGFLSRPFSRELKRVKAEALHGKNSIHILDIGCGHGRPLHELLHSVCEQSKVSVRGTGISLTPFWHPHTPLPTEEYKIGDVFEGIPVGTASIRVAVSVAGPQPRDPEEFTRWRHELNRVMAPGGVLFYQIDQSTETSIGGVKNPFGAGRWRTYHTKHRGDLTILLVKF